MLCTECMLGPEEVRRRHLLELELQRVVNHLVPAGNPTWILYQKH